MQALSAGAVRPFFISRWACGVLSMVMALAGVCTVYLALALSVAKGWPLAVTLAVSVAVAASVWLVTRRLAGRLDGWAARVAGGAWFWPAVVLGLAVRVAYWAATLPAVQINDGLSYWKLAVMLARGEPYFLTGHAYWPPGAPLFYAAFVRLLGEAEWLPLLVNLLCFVLCGLAMRRIVARLNLAEPVAAFGVLLLALWPSFVMTAGQVSKETVLIMLLCASFACLQAGSVGKAWLGGGLGGLAVLTQPSLSLMPLLFGAVLLVRGGGLKKQAAVLAVFVAGLVMAVAPWTYRNYTVFGELVPVSTNAGDVFHAGNQRAMVRPLHEVGGFISPPPPPVEMRTNDLVMSRWHLAEARRFILENPGDFVFLTFQRFIQILGDDSDSAFRSLRLTGKASNAVYALAKACSNGWWLVMVSLLSVLAWKLRTRRLTPEAASLVVMAGLGTLYALFVNGLAEGAARHHMAWVPFYALTLGLALWPGARGEGDGTAA